MSQENISVKVKMTSNNQTYEVSVATDATVADFKRLISEKSGLGEKEQNLVYKGRILADDKSIKDYNIQNDHTIILVKKFVESKEDTKKDETKTTTSTTGTTGTTGTSQPNMNDPFSMFGGQGLGGLGGQGLGGLGGQGMGGMGGLGGVDPSQLSSMMNNPMYMQMMNEMMQDPNTLNMIMNSPQLKPMLDQNPQLRQMMSNPQMMQMLMNPQNLQNAMSMMGAQGGQGLGGQGLSGQGLSGQGLGGQGLGGQPNPFSSFSNLNVGGQSTTQNVDPKEAYQTQNQALKDMGFTNEDLNLDILKQTGGNVDAAVERLLNLLG